MTKAEKTRNHGTMTEAQLTSLIASALRGASRWWKPKAECIKGARVGRGLYKCTICNTIGPATLPAPPGKKRKVKNILADHIKPVVGPEGFTTWDSWIERCFVEIEGYQAICAKCHKIKTDLEQTERRQNRANLST